MYQLFKFSLVGGAGTTAHYLLLCALIQLFGIGAVIASTVGAVVGALVNYVLNYHYTFMSRKRHRESISKFFIVAIIGFMVNAAVLSAAIKQFGLHYMAGQILATGTVFIGSYTINRSWTF